MHNRTDRQAHFGNQRVGIADLNLLVETAGGFLGKSALIELDKFQVGKWLEQPRTAIEVEPSLHHGGEGFAVMVALRRLLNRPDDNAAMAIIVLAAILQDAIQVTFFVEETSVKEDKLAIDFAVTLTLVQVDVGIGITETEPKQVTAAEQFVQANGHAIAIRVVTDEAAFCPPLTRSLVF